MDQVIRMIDDAPPGDAYFAAHALKLACHAAADSHQEAGSGDRGRDVAALQADWKRFGGIYRCLQTMLPGLHGRDVAGELRAASQYLARVMVGISRRVSALPGSASALRSMGAAADRAFADLYEPWIDDHTPADNILFCANKLWQTDARERAIRLYLRYQSTLDRDAEMQAFLTEPRPLLDHYGAAVLVRAEFRKAWDGIADLCYDSPEWLKLYNADVPAESMPPGVHADYPRALAAIAGFRSTTLAAQQPVMDPTSVKAIDAALNGLERLLGALASNLMIHRHLAQFYRESGQPDLAMPHLTAISTFDSHDPEARIGIIDATRRMMNKGQASRAQIGNARDLAARLRDAERGSSKVGYWEAEILVMEFSLGLGDIAAVNDTLSFMHRNRSDISRDLVAPRIEGDD